MHGDGGLAARRRSPRTARGDGPCTAANSAHADSLLDRHVHVAAVHVVEVDDVGLQSLQAPIDGLAYVGGIATDADLARSAIGRISWMLGPAARLRRGGRRSAWRSALLLLPVVDAAVSMNTPRSTDRCSVASDSMSSTSPYTGVNAGTKPTVLTVNWSPSLTAGTELACLSLTFLRLGVRSSVSTAPSVSASRRLHIQPPFVAFCSARHHHADAGGPAVTVLQLQSPFAHGASALWPVKYITNGGIDADRGRIAK